MANKVGSLAAIGDVVALGGLSSANPDGEAEVVFSGTFLNAVVAIEAETPLTAAGAGGTWAPVGTVNLATYANPSNVQAISLAGGSPSVPATFLAQGLTHRVDLRARLVSIGSGSVTVEINSGKSQGRVGSSPAVLNAINQMVLGISQLTDTPLYDV